MKPLTFLGTFLAFASPVNISQAYGPNCWESTPTCFGCPTSDCEIEWCQPCFECEGACTSTPASGIDCKNCVPTGRPVFEKGYQTGGLADFRTELSDSGRIFTLGNDIYYLDTASLGRKTLYVLSTDTVSATGRDNEPVEVRKWKQVSEPFLKPGEVNRTPAVSQ